MTIINRNNYEIYIIDYLDGNLSEQTREELMKFLAQNPDLEAEFDLMKNDNPLPVEDDTFENKEVLKKNIENEPINNQNIEEWCIAAIEEDLSENAKFQFTEALKNTPDFQKIFAQFLKTKLEKQHIPYPGFKAWKLPDFNAKPQIGDIDYWLIAAFEKDLSAKQLHQLNQIKTRNPNVEKSEKLLKSTFLKPDNIVFPAKEQLKKRKNKTRYLYPISGVAAAAAMFYLFISIANISDDTYKKYNKQVAVIEQEAQKTYTSKSGLMNPAMKEHLITSINYYSAKQKSKKSQNTQSQTEQVQKIKSTLETIDLRKATLKTPDINMTEMDDIQIISANQLNAHFYAQNQTGKGMNLNNDDKITFFKAAQKGVEAMNKKVGTKMDLDAQYNKKGKKKKIHFSTKLFTFTKTVGRN